MIDSEQQLLISEVLRLQSITNFLFYYYNRNSNHSLNHQLNQSINHRIECNWTCLQPSKITTTAKRLIPSYDLYFVYLRILCNCNQNLDNLLQLLGHLLNMRWQLISLSQFAQFTIISRNYENLAVVIVFFLLLVLQLCKLLSIRRLNIPSTEYVYLYRLFVMRIIIITDKDAIDDSEKHKQMANGQLNI